MILTDELKEIISKTYEYKKKSKRPNTIRTYKSHWKSFESWCDKHGLCSIPTSAEAISLFLGSLGGTASFSLIDGVIAAIEDKHKEASLSISGNHDLYRSVRKGIRNVHKEKQVKKKAKPITTLDLKVACCNLSNSLKDKRDRAILTLLYFGAFRRSELVGLDVEHVKFQDKGVVISVLQSKTSDTSEEVYLAYAKDKDICPVTNLKQWLEAAAIQSGAIFRSFIKGGMLSARLSGHDVNAIVKEHFGGLYSGHSGRRGILTESASKDTSIHIMQKQSRHKDINSLVGYVEAAHGFENSFVSVLGV